VVGTAEKSFASLRVPKDLETLQVEIFFKGETGQKCAKSQLVKLSKTHFTKLAKLS
jgi:hypothetical protein